MLDPIYYKDKLPELKQALQARNDDPALADRLAVLFEKRSALTQEIESLRGKRNAVSGEIGKLKAQAKKDPKLAKEADAKVKAMRELGDKLKAKEDQGRENQTEFESISLGIGNIPHPDVPRGSSAEQNEEVRKWGDPTHLPFKPKDHIDLGENLGILDFTRAAKLAGARFAVYKGPGAALERAIAQFMLDVQTQQHGYTEFITPFMVNRQTLSGTGQLPKFEAELFKTSTEDKEYFLIPTAEVTLTGMYAGEILDKKDLPIYLTAFTPCFRSEAGSYGKDTRGLIRQHQFQKVELVKITEPESSFDELEKMVGNAEKILQLLEIPYRVMRLSTGDMSFASAMTYDLEVWLPGQNAYREISSCSNCTDFQARRMKTRFRAEPKAKPRLVHTLNGSGLAVGRTFIAVLENYQDGKGRVRIPEVLHDYLKNVPGVKKDGNHLFLG